MGKNFRETLSEQLKDENFKKEYDSMDSEYQLINALLSARKARNITQQQLSQRTGITQGDISKIENGSANPSIKTLRKLATGMDMSLKIEFIPLNKSN